MKTEIKIELTMPDKTIDDYKYRDLLEKVCDYILVCESDEDSEYHWRYLKCLYTKLQEKPGCICNQVEIMEKLEELFEKFARQDSGEGQLDLEGKDMFRYRDSIG